MARRSSRQALPTYDESAGSSFNVSRLITIVICVAAVGSLWRGLLGDGYIGALCSTSVIEEIKIIDCKFNK